MVFGLCGLLGFLNHPLCDPESFGNITAHDVADTRYVKHKISANNLKSGFIFLGLILQGQESIDI